MNYPDLINGLFEAFGSFAILLSVLKILQTKSSKGAHWLTTFFFTSWGLWNLYYYYSLEQYFSWYAGMAVVVVNAAYLWFLLRYYSK